MVPAAHMATVFSVAMRCTAPITWASEGSLLASFAGAAVTSATVACQSVRALASAAAKRVSPRAASIFSSVDLGVADDADGAVLQRVVAVDVDRDEPALRVGEDRPRAGGEVLEAGADADHEVGGRAGLVAAGRAGDAGRAEVHRVLPGGRALAGLGLEDRDVAALGEVGEQVLGAGVEHAAAGDDDRGLRGADRGDDLGDLDRVGLGAADAPDARLEEALGVVVGLGLHVLAEGEADRAAVGRVGHRAQRAGERGQDVLGPGDAVEVAGDGLEAVVGRDGAVVEVLDLLQDRVGAAVGEDVAADEEHRQPVDVGERRRGHHVSARGQYHAARPLDDVVGLRSARDGRGAGYLEFQRLDDPAHRQAHAGYSFLL